MDAYNLYKCLNDLLELKAEFVGGSDVIKVRDTFSIKFTVRNAPMNFGRRKAPERIPKVIFNNVHLSVRGTEFATLVGQPEHDASAPLKPGETAVFSIGYYARQPMGGMEANYTKELVANASVKADLNIEEFFKFKQSLEVHADIVS